MTSTVVCIWLLCLVNLYQGVSIVPSTFIQGQSASITCTDASVTVSFDINNINIIACILSQPVCNIREGEEFNEYRDNYNVTHNSTSLTITIPNVSRNRDSGVWQCVIDGRKISNYTVDVKVPVSSVTIENKNSITFHDGQTTSITCKTGVSHPYATITWSIGGTNVNDGTTTNNPDGTTTSILQYTPDKTDHNKILQCSATNGYGSTKSDSITLNIRCDGGDGFIKGLGTGVGITLAVVFMVVLSIYVYNKYRTSQCQQNKQSEHYSDLNPATRTTTTEETSPTYQELDSVTISPSSASPRGQDQPSSSSSHPQELSSSRLDHLSLDVKVYENLATRE